MKRKNSLIPNGFTLIELLIVIVIIAVLVALSLMGYTRMKTAADGVGIVTNLRQLQAANMSYATDNNGRFASYYIRDENGSKVYWHRNPEFLGYFTGDNSQLSKPNPSLNVSPSLLDPIVIRARARAYTVIPASYGMNSEFMPKRDDEDTARYIEVSRLSDPPRSAAFVTCTDGSAKYKGRKLWDKSPVEGKTTDGKMAFRHKNNAVVVYFDGHTGFITRADIDRFDASGGKNNIFWNADGL